MEKRIKLPEGFEAEVSNGLVKLNYNGKTESKWFKTKLIELHKEGDEIIIKGVNSKRRTIAMVNTAASIIRNLIKGLEKGYVYRLKIIHSHFPMNVQVSGREVIISNFIGERKPRKAKIIGENTVVEIKGKEIIVKGTNKEHVGQTAANIEQATRVKARDPRVFHDGIYLVAKGEA